MDGPRAGAHSTPHWPLRIGIGAFLLIACFFLWTEHRAHLLGALPYLLLLACPIIHLFMHRGHGSHGHDRDSSHAHQDQGKSQTREESK